MKVLSILLLVHLVTSERWFVHYFENSAKRWTEEGGRRIAREAQPYFDHVRTYQKKELGDDFLKECEGHFKHARGAGYWVWKPRIIQLTLEQMKDNDELMYADTGLQLRANPAPLFEHLKDILSFDMPFYLERQYAKRSALIEMGVDIPEVIESGQRMGGVILLRKTSQTVQVINEWLQFAKRLHLVDDSKSTVPNYGGYVEHRHDQTIWSTLTKRLGYPALHDGDLITIEAPLHNRSIIARFRR